MFTKSRVVRQNLKFETSSKALRKWSIWIMGSLIQEPPMRDWLFLLAPPAVIFYFIAFPEQFYAFVAWARYLI
jgi:hypothetical protein